MLDYDGTLAPFHVDRMQAKPLPGVVDALRTIRSRHDVTLILVSGRPVAEVLELLGDDRFTVAGSHGYELHTETGKHLTMNVTPDQAALLDRAFAHARAAFDPARVERKAASVAVHFRGLEPEQYDAVQAELARDWADMSLSQLTEVREFNGGLELRAVGRTKGDIVRETLDSRPAGTLAVYIGDDETDEDAFAALPADGIGIKVGASDVASLAQGRLPDCAAVQRLLVTWTRRTERT